MELISLILAPWVLIFASLISGAAWVWYGSKRIAVRLARSVVGTLSAATATASEFALTISLFAKVVQKWFITSLRKLPGATFRFCLTLGAFVFLALDCICARTKSYASAIAASIVNITTDALEGLGNFFSKLSLPRQSPRPSPFIQAQLDGRIVFSDGQMYTVEEFNRGLWSWRPIMGPDGRTPIGIFYIRYLSRSEIDAAAARSGHSIQPS